MELHLVRHGYDARELSILLILALDDCFNDTRVVGTQVDEAVGYAGLAGLGKEVDDSIAFVVCSYLPQRLKEGKGCCVHVVGCPMAVILDLSGG